MDDDGDQHLALAFGEADHALVLAGCDSVGGKVGAPIPLLGFELSQTTDVLTSLDAS